MRGFLFLIAVTTRLAGCVPDVLGPLQCAVDTDCVAGRACDRGYCVVSETMPDAAVDSRDCASFTTRHFEGCALPPPTVVTLGSGTYTFDTDRRELVGPTGAVIPVASFANTSGVVLSVEALDVTLATTLRATGSRPLVIASWSTISIGGVVDVASTRGGTVGAGANGSQCAAAQPGVANQFAAGGGGGGGFASAGGAGGNGGIAAGGQGTGPGGVGGAAIAPATLVGGCPGGRGGDGDTVDGGSGGNGGGAIQLTARNSIVIDGRVTANGGGGGVAKNDSGGGGGGSGGMIGLAAPEIAIRRTAALTANGGSGSGGSGETFTAQPGNDGAPSSMPVAGGQGVGGGNGGAGGAVATPGGGGGASFDGGGGGGGGSVGAILIEGTLLLDPAAIVSPNRTTL